MEIFYSSVRSRNVHCNVLFGRIVQPAVKNDNEFVNFFQIQRRHSLFDEPFLSNAFLLYNMDGYTYNTYVTIPTSETLVLLRFVLSFSVHMRLYQM